MHKETRDVDQEIIEKYNKFLEKAESIEDEKNENDNNKNKKEIDDIIKVKGSKVNTSIKTSVITLILCFCIVIASFFVCNMYFMGYFENFFRLLMDYYQTQENRHFFLINSIIFQKLFLIENKETFQDSFKDFLNKTITNEQKLNSFIVNGSFKKFNPLINKLTTENVCKFFSDNAKLAYSNNITVLKSQMCDFEDSPYKKIINKSLNEIINYIINFLDTQNNEFYIMKSKDVQSLLKFINSEDFEFIQVLIQFVIRQSIFVVLDYLEKDFNNEITFFFNSTIMIFVIIVIILGFIQVLINYFSQRIFKEIKKVNMFLISILPNEYVNKILDEV